MRLELYDASGATLLATGTAVLNANGQVTGQTLTIPGQSGRTYLVRVLPGPAATADTPSVYTLDVQSLTANLGAQVYGVENGNLTAGANDYYALTAPAPGSLEVILTPGTNAQGNFQLELFDPNNLTTPLASGQTAGTAQYASLALTQGERSSSTFSGTPGPRAISVWNSSTWTSSPPLRTRRSSSPPGRGRRRRSSPTSPAKAGWTLWFRRPDQHGQRAPEQWRRHLPAAAVHRWRLHNAGRRRGLCPGPGSGRGRGRPRQRVSRHHRHQLRIRRRLGAARACRDGTFEPERRYDATVGAFALAVGDLTGNGILDLVVVGSTASIGSTASNGKIAVLLGRGDGTFLPPLLFDSPLTSAYANPLASVQLADLNGDGRLDLLVAGDANIHVLLGNGNGTFRAGSNIPVPASALAVADLNNDGIPDVIGAYINQTVSVELGRGDGTFEDRQVSVWGGPVCLDRGGFRRRRDTSAWNGHAGAARRHSRPAGGRQRRLAGGVVRPSTAALLSRSGRCPGEVQRLRRPHRAGLAPHAP